MTSAHTDRDWERMYREQRAGLAAKHDDGAGDALRSAVYANAGTDCTSYCYGGSPKVDVHEVLADLAELGWRITKTKED